MIVNLRRTNIPTEKLQAANRIDNLTRYSGQWNVADLDDNQAELDRLLEQFDSIEELESAAYDYWNWLEMEKGK